MSNVSPDLPPVGSRIRIAIQYDNQWRPLLWLRVGRDASIYTGLVIGKPGIAVEGEVPADGPRRVEYREGRTLTGAEVPSSSRVSFKASGEVHLGKRTLRGYALTTLRRPTQLCLVVFAHPSRYRAPPAASDKDYDIGIAGYPVIHNRPMYGAIIVEPWTGAGPLLARRLPSMINFVDTVLAFGGFARAPNLAVHVVIGHGITGEWPHLPAIAIVSPPHRSGK